MADDNCSYGTLLTRFVSSQPDMEVVGYASDGSEAVRLACLLKPDLVLMDLCMPGLDGFEATKAIADTQVAMKVIALTAHRAADSEQRCIEAGASAFLCKAEADLRLLDLIRGLTAPCTEESDLTGDRAPERPPN